MFGQAGNSSFGFNTSAQNSPFGQSAFGKTVASTSFGTSAPPVFGSNSSLFSSKPTGSTSGGLFGITTATPTFGANAASQASFGGFGSTNSGTPLFGNQQNSNTNLFGSNNGAPAFGQSNKGGGFGFGQSAATSLFGQSQQQATQQATPFGQSTSAANSGLFGTTTGFGAASTVSGISGTIVKFNPVTGTDTMVKNGVTQTISTRHHCITCMKEYESKSLEELRLEDYTAGRKGVSQGQSNAIFGAGTQNSPFGTVTSNSSGSSSGFGAIAGAFGNSSQSGSGSLFAKPIAGFGTPATTSTAFAFNPTTSSNLFNTQSKPFGSTAPTPLFAANNTSNAGNAFGNMNSPSSGFGTGFTSATSNQTIGLFSQNKPAFSMPSSTSSTSFGFGQTPATNTASIFGSKSIGTGFGTTFGGTGSSTFQTGNTGFGSTQNTTSSLFNNSFKPTAQSSGFTFGNIPAAVSTGIGTSGNTLFNPSTKSNLFGNSGSTANFNTTGTFGSIPGFGSAHNTISALSTNLFGSGISTNFQQNTGTVPVHQQILALVSAPFGDSPLLKNLLPASGKSEQFLKPNTLGKNLSNSHYKILTGNNAIKPKPKVVATAPLSKKSLFDGLEEEDPLLEAFQPRPNSKRLVLRPKSQCCTNNLGASNDKILRNEKPDHGLTETISEVIDKENEIVHSWLKSNVPRKSKIFSEEYSDQAHIVPVTSSITLGELENTVSEFRPPSTSESLIKSSHNASAEETVEINVSVNKTNLDFVHREHTSPAELKEILSSTQKLNELENKANITLERYGYYTIPPVDTLHKYVKDNTCIIPNFTIGRNGYGNVYFEDSFDVYGLNLDEIVHFRHKEVIIYPDDTVKPLIGQGLNRRAQVTLDRVWPHDKSSHEPITDPKRLIEMDYEGKLRRVAAKHDTKFLEYRPETGSWVFKVDHFSKYGLSDSDDEDSEIKTSQSDSPMKLCETLIEQPIIDDPNYRELHLPAIENKDAVSYSFNFSTFDHEKVLNMQSVCSPSSVHARLVGTESHTLQLMKASFFEFANNDFTQESINQTQRLHYQCSQDVAKLCNVIRKADEKEIPYSCLPSIIAQDDSASDFENSIMNRNKFSVDNSMGVEMKNALEVPNFGPKIAILKFKSGVAQFKNSMFYNHRLKYVADIGIQMGKIFKPSWGPGLKIIVPLNVQPNTSNICSQNSLDCSYGDIKCTNVVQCFQFLGYRCLENDYNQALKSSIEGHLNIQLLYSKIENYEDCPFITAVTDSSSITALRSHKSHSLSAACNSDVITPEPLSTYFANVWTLCESLWGQISDSEPSLNNNSHEDAMLRKDAVSNWLKLITAQTIQSEVTEMEIKDEIILSLLSANKLEEACDTALKDGDHCLALLLSQLGGTITTRELIKQQIELWQDTDVDKNFSVNRLKLFMLVAGVPITYRNNEAVNICENLDWKRALAIHLWYISYPTSSIADALNLYETSFFASAMNIYSASPRPEYFKNETVTETTNGKPAYDLCYYLIKLYCVGNFSLEVLLDPQTYTYDPIDYSLSWFLQQILKSLGYTHLSEHTSELLHANFAAQLETYDLWQWAIFVVLHFKNPIRRCRAITELLLRNADLNKASEYIKSEIFLKTKLHLSCKWINEAKAVKSLAMQRYGEAAWYFIQAQDWNKGHEIILQHLATEAIINEDYDYVQSLLSLLVSNNSSNIISEWGSQGQLIWDYITVTTEVKRLLKEGKYSDIVYNLELLKPQLTTLCTKIDQFPCPTVKHRLCQAEMAKKTLHLARNLLMLQQKESSKEHNTNNFLIRLISQLPLPEDYAQQELRPIINICINNIVSQ